MIFHTGLTGAEFARQKRSYLLTLRGCVLSGQHDADFSFEEWQAEKVEENQGFMDLYGKGDGERLDVLLEGDKQTALSAVLFWKAGLDFLANKAADDKAVFDKIVAAPCGVFVNLEKQTLFFPPRDLIRTAVEAEGETAWLGVAKRWMHPDREGTNALNWTFAACLYRIFAGFAPFAVPTIDVSAVPAISPKGNKPAKNAAKTDLHIIEDTLSGDMREGVLIPADLAAPGLRTNIVQFIDSALVPHIKAGMLPITEIGEIDRDFEKNIAVLTEDALSFVKARREAVEQKKAKKIKTKRFLARNKSLIKGLAAGVVILGVVIGSFVQGQLQKWSTKGLTPAEVVTAYYDAFGNLDHEAMSACTDHEAGKADVEMVTNIFVISKMREAYEQKKTVINAADWDETMPPPDDISVFGVLRLATDWPAGGANGEIPASEITAHSRYDLVVPSSLIGDDTAAVSRIARDDTLRLQWQKNRWRITEIDRRERL
jgi:hypothetical protein